MLSKSQLRLVAVMAIIGIAQASVVDARGAVFVRQQSSSVGTGNTVPTSVVETPESSPTTSPSSTPTQAPSPSTTPPTTSPTPTPTTTPNTPTPTPNTPTPVATPTTNTTPTTTPTTPATSPTTSSKTSTKTSTSTSSSVSLINTSTITPTVVVVTSLQTVSGSTITQTSSSTDTAAFASATSAAAAANSAAATTNNTSNKDKGMSTGTRNTIIGVVVGIGGAAILAGLFIVAWRIWGRKKNTPDESDDLMGTGFGSAPGEKPSSSGSPAAANPFQSTLETYHNPAARGNVNASSNF